MAGVHKSHGRQGHSRPSGRERGQARADPRPAQGIRLRVNPLAKGVNYQKKKLVVGVLLTGRAVPTCCAAWSAFVRTSPASTSRSTCGRHAADTKAQARCAARVPRSPAQPVLPRVSSGGRSKTSFPPLHEAGIPLILVHHAPEKCAVSVPHRAEGNRRAHGGSYVCPPARKRKARHLRIPGERTRRSRHLRTRAPRELAEAAETKPPQARLHEHRALLTPLPRAGRALYHLQAACLRSAAPSATPNRPSVRCCCAWRTAAKFPPVRGGRSPVRSCRPRRAGALRCACCSSIWSTSASPRKTVSARRPSSQSRKTAKATPHNESCGAFAEIFVP